MKILLNGICGRMGSEIASLLTKGYKNAQLAAGVDINCTQAPVSCYKDFEDVKEAFDCVIDFSHHLATRKLLDYCVSHEKPVVIATTGHTEEELVMIKEAAKYIPVFFSMNMSVGIALLCELAKTTVKTFPDADIEIVEAHHNRKLDAPSGTAIMIADAIKTARDNLFCVFGRGGQKKREKNEIGMHSIRMGNIIGEHSVIVGTDTQTITLKHEAHDRVLFAEGAVEAALFLVGKPAGLYSMNDMIK